MGGGDMAMTTEHFSTWDEDDDGFITLGCSCGWTPGGAMPDAETAADVWGDHRYDVGYADGRQDGVA